MSGHPNKLAIVNGGGSANPEFVQVHQITHQRTHAPPKVYYGNAGKGEVKEKKTGLQENTAQPRIADIEKPKVPTSLPITPASNNQPEQLIKVAKNKMGTMQVNQKVDLKAMFCD